MSCVLKATIIENKTTSVTKHFKKQQETTCLLSQLLSIVTVTSCSFTSIVHFAAGRRTQAGDATDQWRCQ